MKQKLLSLFALAGAMFMSTSAWAIDPPEEVEPAFTTEWVAPEDGGVYFLYNVGADQYLGAGNHWGTHVVTATVSDESSTQVYFWDAGIALSGGSSDMNTCVGVLPIKLTKTEDGTYYIEHMGSNRSACYLTSEDAQNGVMTNSWIDGDLGRSAKFNIVAVEGGYTIQATNTVDAGTYFGAADPEEEPAEGEEVVRNVMNNLTEGQNIIWRFAPTNYVLCMAYEVRISFYEKIVEAQDEGVDTKEAEALYNNPNATPEQIQAAINGLTVAINKAKFETLLGGATAEDPIEATEYVLENPDFELGNISGWTTNYKSGQQANNIGYQGASYTNGDVTISKFIEAWKSDGSPWTIGDGYLQQTVYGLPQGKYVLEADAVSVYQWANHDADGGIGKNPAEGVYLFIQAGQYEAKQALATGNGQPEHFAVTFVNDGSDELTFGLKTESATANWIAADNFRIYYYGKTEYTPAQAELESAILAAQNVDTNVPANAADLAAFEKALEEAQATLAKRPDDDTCNAAREALKAANDAFTASAKAYQDFETFFGTGGTYEALLEQVLEHENWTELATSMDTYNRELQEKYIDYTLTTEEVYEAEDHIQSLILDFISGDNINEGDDITLLLKNPDFSMGTTANPTGWVIKSGSLTELAAATGNIETWHKTFDISQTIKNMPAGVYDITVQGFVRHDNESSTDGTVFYAGDTRTTLMTLEDQWSLDPIYVDGGENPYLHDGNYDLTLTTPSGETAYKCNGMGGAYYWFNTPILDATDFLYQPQEGDNFYTNHIKITLRQAGDLEIGLMTTSTTDWVIWDNFKIKYAGNSLEIYYQMIEEAQAKMMAAVNAEGAFVTKAAAAKVDALNGRVDKMEELTSGDEALALIAEIEEATNYIKAGRVKGAALQDAVDLYTELSSQISTSDPALPELLSKTESQIADPASIESNEAVDDIIASFKKAWGAYVLYDAAEEPADKYEATYAIFNYNYFHPVKAENSSEGWTVENVGGAYAANFSEMESYNNDTTYIYQTLEGLKAGFYEVDLQGYYRAGYSGAYNAEQGDSLKQVHNAYIYATTSVGEMTQPLLNAIEGAQEATLGVGAETAIKMTTEDGETEVFIPENMEAAATYFENGFYPNTLKVQVGEDGVLTLAIRKWNHIEGDWIIFTNWELYYLGKTGKNFADELTAVQGIEKAAVKAAQIFTIDGRQAARMNRGINIVRMSDGSVRKVLVK